MDYPIGSWQRRFVRLVSNLIGYSVESVCALFSFCVAVFVVLKPIVDDAQRLCFHACGIVMWPHRSREMLERACKNEKYARIVYSF